LRSCEGKLLEEFPLQLKVVRVYSQYLERQIFPIPRYDPEVKAAKERGYKINQTLKCNEIGLHQLIRAVGSPYSKEIRQFDDRFSKNLRTPDSVTDEEIREYEILLEEACKIELADCDVIYCTAIGSASVRIIKSTNVTRLIVDEAGMCTEPETLVPIVNYPSVEQVVLIGDHKQLQPIVHCQEVKKLGLPRSMFERFSVSGALLTQLRTQYRMVSLLSLED